MSLQGAVAQATLRRPPYLGFLPIIHQLWDFRREDLQVRSGAQIISLTDVKTGFVLAAPSLNARPTFNPSGLNSAPCGEFDGLDDCLDAVGVGEMPAGGAGGDIWLLGRQDGNAGTDTGARVAFAYGDAAATRRSAERTVIGGVNRARGTNTGTFASNALVDFSGPVLLRIVIRPTSVRVDVNGVADPAPVSVTTNTGTARTRIGALSSASPSAYWLGGIAIVAATEPLGDAAAAAFTSQLKTIGGIP